MTDEEIEKALYENYDKTITDWLDCYGVLSYIKRLKVENATLKKNADEAYQQGLNEMKELVAPEIRKETAKEILRELVENKFNIGKALYRQSIDEDCDVVSVDTLKLVIAEKYYVEAQ